MIWLDNIKDLQWLAKVKKEKNIKILAVPTAYQIHQYHNEIRQLYIDTVDIHLTASYIETNMLKNIDLKENMMISWPSGLKLGNKNQILCNKKCICYFKAIPFDANLISQIEELGIECTPVIYYQHINYNYFDWKEKLQQVDFVIFITNSQETQGLAYMEAWAENKPTIHPKGLCPYSTKETSLEYNSIEELFEILKQYMQKPQEFLQQFSPYEYIKNNYTDEISVQNLLKIIDKMKNSTQDNEQEQK